MKFKVKKLNNIREKSKKMSRKKLQDEKIKLYLRNYQLKKIDINQMDIVCLKVSHKYTFIRNKNMIFFSQNVENT